MMTGGRTTTGRWLRGVSAFALLCLLSACVDARLNTAVLDPRNGNGDGLGGTGIKQAVVSPRGDGLGGTGILGTITGFGSIIVNGLELEFSHTTLVEDDGKPASLEHLRVGQVVEGVAHPRDGKLYLDTLEIQHAVSGPISAIDYAGGTLTVLGQKVRLNLGGDKAGTESFKTLQKDDVVSVSGLRLADGTIMATRVDQRRDDGRTIVRGEATSVSTTNLRIGDLDVPLRDVVTTTPPKAGSRVFVSGRILNNAFVADVVAASGGFVGEVKEVSLEAYVSAEAAKGGVWTVNGMTVTGASLPAGAAVNDRVVVTGRLGADNKIAATSVTKIKTVVSLMQARGTMRPAWLRPDMGRPERVRPPERPERPQTVRPERPQIERPQGNCC
ncbi:MAG: hypothetical protein EXQ84_04995 [Rhodospirillaceae bacterium]|nr:hypothetical protein [Rhodospirillaceae bacterium]